MSIKKQHVQWEAQKSTLEQDINIFSTNQVDVVLFKWMAKVQNDLFPLQCSYFIFLKRNNPTL